MNVLVLGGGGREHALVRSLALGGSTTDIVAVPGNPGIEDYATCRPGTSITDPTDVVAVAETASADLVIVGPEAPLAAGVADALRTKGFPTLGPDAAAARLEASKAFSKEIMRAAGVPTATANAHRDPESARADLDRRQPPFVVKADGLAAGKGVIVTDDRAEAVAWVDRCFDGDFGAAGTTVIVEDHLDGPELSVFALCAGGEAVAFGAARDHKRLLDADEGPNTGGMGCFSPVPGVDRDATDEVVRTIIAPVLAELADRGIDYRGILYAGLAITHQGPSVVEFNVRMGDPEAEVVLPLLASDPAPLFASIAQGRVPRLPLQWREAAAVDVVLAAPGYPEDPRRGMPVTGLDLVAARDDVVVFHAGTARDTEGRVVASGGRVLNVVGIGPDLDAARRSAYDAAADIHFDGVQMRSDIAEGL